MCFNLLAHGSVGASIAGDGPLCLICQPAVAMGRAYFCFLQLRTRYPVPLSKKEAMLD